MVRFGATPMMEVQVGGSDVTVPSATLSLTSEEDEIIIPDGITAISYSFTEDGEPITRQIAVEPTDKVKYYKEEDGYYTLAIYGSDGAIKSKGYTLHSDDIPKIDVTYSADVNNNFTESDEYVEFIPTSVEVITQNPYTWIAPEGVTKLKYAVYFTSAGKELLFTSAITDVISGASYLFCYDTSAKTLVVPGLPKYTNIFSANLFNRYEIRTGTSINNS